MVSRMVSLEDSQIGARLVLVPLQTDIAARQAMLVRSVDCPQEVHRQQGISRRLREVHGTAAAWVDAMRRRAWARAVTVMRVGWRGASAGQMIEGQIVRPCAIVAQRHAFMMSTTKDVARRNSQCLADDVGQHEEYVGRPTPTVSKRRSSPTWASERGVQGGHCWTSLPTTHRTDAVRGTVRRTQARKLVPSRVMCEREETLVLYPLRTRMVLQGEVVVRSPPTIRAASYADSSITTRIL
jgi:hypothetical protein